jgi:2C-methyl-D-erythritol 2,4-cyclodiphosphate synthase
MTLPTQPVTLTAEQIGELNEVLATMRHDINNSLSLMIAATELIRHKPQMAERMAATLTEQPPKITNSMQKFSASFEQTLGISR